MKKLRRVITSLLIMSIVLVPVKTACADAVTEKPYLSLGADLTEQQKNTVLELLGVKDDLDNYDTMEVTNAEEHKYLGNYISASVIGNKALSSVLVVKSPEGTGIGVETKNISYCTSGMYSNALVTAGVEDADVIVAGPFSITGTAALLPDRLGKVLGTKKQQRRLWLWQSRRF